MSTLTLSRVYQYSFHAHPNITLALTGGCLNSLGDMVAQITEKMAAKKDEYRPYDLVRTLRFFTFGLIISPFLGRWNRLLETRFPLRTIPGSQRISLKALSKRVFCDQIIMAPIGLGIFFGLMGAMELKNARQIKEKFDDLYKATVLTNWKVWPIAQLINFRYMPLAYRVPFQSGCGVFWTLYLSHINAREGEYRSHRN